MNDLSTMVLCVGLAVGVPAAGGGTNLVPQTMADGSPRACSAHLLETAADPAQKCSGSASVPFDMLGRWGPQGITVYLFPVDRQVEKNNEAILDDVRLFPEDRPEMNLLQNGDMKEVKDGHVVGWTRSRQALPDGPRVRLARRPAEDVPFRQGR